MRNRVREKENGACRAVQHSIDYQVVSICIVTHAVHDAVRKFPKSVDMLLLTRSQCDRSFVSKRPVASLSKHPHLGEFFVEASLIGWKPPPIKACRQPL